LNIDPREFERQYRALSDEGLLSIEREDLTDIARSYYDAEVARRGLQSTEEEDEEAANPGEELVQVATFVTFEEANLARALLQSADIPAYLENEVGAEWAGIGGLRLAVPASLVEQAEEILEASISEEDLIAQAEAAESTEADDEDDPD
jgi:Putative prokaryotic signal transducing protein